MRLLGILILTIYLGSCSSDKHERNEVQNESKVRSDQMLNDTLCDCQALEIDEKKNIVHIGGTDSPYNGWCVLYRRGGKLESKRQYVNGKLNGDFYNYHPNGNLESSIPHKNNRYDGRYLKFSQNGDTIYNRLYKNGAAIIEDSIQ
ncbi:MAG: hypothetical protein R2799_06500 [Crocinitomicaceae bacterium]